MDIILVALKISALVLLTLLIIGTILSIRVILPFKKMINRETQKTEKECSDAKKSQRTD